VGDKPWLPYGIGEPIYTVCVQARAGSRECPCSSYPCFQFKRGKNTDDKRYINHETCLGIDVARTLPLAYLKTRTYVPNSKPCRSSSNSTYTTHERQRQRVRQWHHPKFKIELFDRHDLADPHLVMRRWTRRSDKLRSINTMSVGHQTIMTTIIIRRWKECWCPVQVSRVKTSAVYHEHDCSDKRSFATS
jgi:hypothetical protein